MNEISTTDRFERNIDKLFEKIEGLTESTTTVNVLLKGIEKTLACLPCQDHTNRLTLIDKEVFPDGKNSKIREMDTDLHAFKYGWSIVIGAIGIISIAVSIIIKIW